MRLETDTTIDVTAIVVSYDTRELLAECIASIPAQDNVEIIVVDNGSSDGSPAMVRESFPRVRVIENEANLGFVAATNQGIRAGRGRYVLLLNSDAALLDGALKAMVELADATPRAAIVGARVLNPDGSFQASHARFPTVSIELLILTGFGRWMYGPWYPSHGPDDFRAPAAVDYVSGACLLARRAAIDEVGPLDEGYFMYVEEVDWCYEMKRAGWQVWYQPHASVTHHGAASSRGAAAREALLYRGRVRFFRKHYGDRAARRLKRLIVVTSAAKAVADGLLRLIGRRERRRARIRMKDLLAALRDA